jgi:hypothetical protein
VWLTERHHLLAWVLSVESVSAHYADTALVTDDAGADLLVNRLGLRFKEVSTTLNALSDADPGWWVLGKLSAYRLQTRPFVHLDNDVFLWKPLPERLTRAPVFGQNPESFFLDDSSWYRPEFVDAAVRRVQGWLPEEWCWYVARKKAEAICCGIVGGTNVDFLAHYADTAIEMIEHPVNESAWASIGSVIGDNILVEQYLLAACIEYHRQAGRHRFQPPEAAYLFESWDEAFDESAARKAGYTHLIGGAKANRDIMQRLERRVRRDFPQLNERVGEIANEAIKNHGTAL